MKNNREDHYPFADDKPFRGKEAAEIFNDIYHQNIWHVTADRESVSGIGSSLEQTREIIDHLPKVFRKFDIHSMLDIPCGDFNWMRHLDLSGISYTGADIVGALVEKNHEKYKSRNKNFIQLNLMEDPLPTIDLIFCRDCLVHFSFGDIFRALENIRKSGSKYLMTTTFTEQGSNKDIHTGGWRPLNLQRVPFHFPEPLFLLNEKCTELDGLFKDKSLGVWMLDRL